MSRKKSTGQNKSQRPTNVWDFLTKVLIASLNKGQLPAMFIGLYILIFCFRIPSEEITPFFKEVINSPGLSNVIGWIGFGGSVTISFYLNRRLRRKHTKEIQRISEEKTRLQEKLSNIKLPSSNDRN